VIAATVDNLSSMPASEVVVRSDLPAGSIFRADLSSPGCAQIGLMVECPITGLAPGAQSSVEVGLEPVIAGPLNTTLTVGSWECDTLPADNTAIASVDVVAAAPCDANFDLAIDSDDLVPAAEHIFGTDAVGNPDCRVGDGITADDLAAIIEQGFVD
jgi:hypothetical protein